MQDWNNVSKAWCGSVLVKEANSNNLLELHDLLIAEPRGWSFTYCNHIFPVPGSHDDNKLLQSCLLSMGLLTSTTKAPPVLEKKRSLGVSSTFPRDMQTTAGNGPLFYGWGEQAERNYMKTIRAQPLSFRFHSPLLKIDYSKECWSQYNIIEFNTSFDIISHFSKYGWQRRAPWGMNYLPSWETYIWKYDAGIFKLAGSWSDISTA